MHGLIGQNDCYSTKKCLILPLHIGIPGDSGVTYTRWGNSSCPSSTGAQLVYAGRAGGSHYTHTGGGAEKLCLPNDPDYTFLGQQVSQYLPTFMVQNMNSTVAPTQTSISTTYHVLFAMFLPEPQLSWFLLSLRAHHPGPGSTTAI